MSAAPSPPQNTLKSTVGPSPPICGLGPESMYEVTVEDTFSSGHYLRNYKGKCERPHGHNYRVRVTLSGEELDQAGLLLDFKDLKDVLRPVVNYLDHQMMNDLEPFTTLNPWRKHRQVLLRPDQCALEGHNRRPRTREGHHHLGDRHHDRPLQRIIEVDSRAVRVNIKEHYPNHPEVSNWPFIYPQTLTKKTLHSMN